MYTRTFACDIVILGGPLTISAPLELEKLLSVSAYVYVLPVDTRSPDIDAEVSASSRQGGFEETREATTGDCWLWIIAE